MASNVKMMSGPELVALAEFNPGDARREAKRRIDRGSKSRFPREVMAMTEKATTVKPVAVKSSGGETRIEMLVRRSQGGRGISHAQRAAAQAELDAILGRFDLNVGVIL